FARALNYFGYAARDFTLTVTPTPAPPNDNFADRIALTGSVVSATGSTVSATREMSEPQHSFYGGGSVWWSWTAPGPGLYALDATGASPGQQLRTIAVYVGD